MRRAWSTRPCTPWGVPSLRSHRARGGAPARRRSACCTCARRLACSPIITRARAMRVAWLRAGRTSLRAHGLRFRLCAVRSRPSTRGAARADLEIRGLLRGDVHTGPNIHGPAPPAPRAPLQHALPAAAPPAPARPAAPPPAITVARRSAGRPVQPGVRHQLAQRTQTTYHQVCDASRISTGCRPCRPPPPFPAPPARPPARPPACAPPRVSGS